MKIYRDTGAKGALLDEYEKSISELKSVIQKVTPEQLVAIVDPETQDADCRSIQTILTHVVESGYTYVISIRKNLGELIDYREKELFPTISDYENALDQMFAFNLQLFEDHPDLKLEEYNFEKKILVRWGQRYDPEQILEHAIVHILRHRRQIERFLLKLS